MKFLYLPVAFAKICYTTLPVLLHLLNNKTNLLEMKKIILSFLGLAMLSMAQAQSTHTRVLNKSNMRDGESVEYCTTHKKMEAILSDPDRSKQYLKEQQEFEELLNNSQKSGTEKAIEYTIPVVFHVLHNGGSENISTDQIMRALEILNRDYAMLNADTATIQAPFQSIRAKADIKFALATKAPNGACFSGITRTQSILTEDGDNGTGQVNAIIAGNDVYQGNWPGNKYLNIFICEDIGGAAGYTFNPGSWSATSMGNGIWVLSTYVGDNGTSSLSSSRTLTHEVGHWLNLSHVWGGTNDPGVSCGSDQVNDTPACIGSTSCSLNANTCSSDNAFWGFDQIDNVENYMDYSYCSKMFTAGQVTRMRTALTVANTGRANIVSAANLLAVGANATPALCQAKFSTNKKVVCVGETIELTDETYNLATGWTWSFPGGSPTSANTQDASVSYSAPGTYTVTLLATDGSSSDDYTMQITVLPQDEGLPYYEGFEGLSSFTGSTRWFVENGNGNAWSVTNTAGNSGTNSAKLTSFGQPEGSVDNLISGKIDLSQITSATGATLSFRCAFRKTESGNLDLLKVYASTDCGSSWDVRKTLSANTMSESNIAASAWTPGAADWVTVHVTNISSTYWVEDFRFRFDFRSDGGNNIFIDDINLYAGPQSDVLVLVGLEELSTVSGAMVFPNPADAEVNVKFSSAMNQDMTVIITDITGKIIQQHAVKAVQGDNLVFISTDTIAAGSYFVRLSNGTQYQTLPFIVK
jgi:PKD repeat protein